MSELTEAERAQVHAARHGFGGRSVIVNNMIAIIDRLTTPAAEAAKPKAVINGQMAVQSGGTSSLSKSGGMGTVGPSGSAEAPKPEGVRRPGIDFGESATDIGMDQSHIYGVKAAPTKCAQNLCLRELDGSFTGPCSLTGFECGKPQPSPAASDDAEEIEHWAHWLERDCPKLALRLRAIGARAHTVPELRTVAQSPAQSSDAGQEVAGLLPEDADERRMFNSDVELHNGSPLSAIRTALTIWSRMNPRLGSLSMTQAIYSNEIAKADAELRRLRAQPPRLVDVEMVQRFYEAYKRNDWPVFNSVKHRIKEGLEAALPGALGAMPTRDGLQAAMIRALTPGEVANLKQIGRFTDAILRLLGKGRA